MNTITCHVCQVDVLVDNASTVSSHRTSEGTIGYIRCPLGHLSVVRFARARPSVRVPRREPCSA
jgi:hypothetical protein